MKTAAQLKHELKTLRANVERAIDEYDGKSMPESVVTNLRQWSDEIDALMAQYKAAKASEDRLDGERQQMQGIFGGNGQPTTDGTPETKSGARGFAGAILNAGWDLRSKPAVTVSMSAALERKDVDLSSTTPATYRPRQLGNIADLGYDRRYLWPHLQSEGVGDETAISDFRQTGSRTITGNVERAIAATSEKATLDLALDAVTEQLKTLAVLIDNIPNQVLRSIPGIVDFFNTEARYAVDAALDAHVVAQILAATPPNGENGTDLFAQVRNAIAAMRANGYSPDLLVLDGTDSAALDLLQDNEARFYYGLDGRGDTATVFGVRVIERTAAAAFDPLLIDSSAIGRLYLGTLRLEADPFTGFSTNQTDLRLEGNALMHVRAANAAYRIAAA